jgi:hypothetical protein
VAVVILRGDFQTGVVAEPLLSPIVIRVTRDGVGASGVAVSAQVTGGNGTVTPASATSNSSGEVSLQWTLGTGAGPQSVTVSSGSATKQLSATARAGPVATLDTVTGSFQYAVVGQTAAAPPEVVVRDRYGNPVEGVFVEFLANELDTRLGQAGTQTGPDGRAGVLRWTLGMKPGPQRLAVASAGLVGAEFIAFGTPATVVAIAPLQQTANVATEVPTPPGVRAFDADGGPLPGVTVGFVVRAGGGRAVGATGVTAPDGTFRAAGWILGAGAGENRLEPVVEGLTALPVFLASGVDAVPASVIAVGPVAQSGLLGNFVTALPTVRVVDGAGRPVGGLPVTFTTLSGGGTVGLTTPALDHDGLATLGSWRLGPAGSVQEVRATVGSLPPVTFRVDASPPPPSGFAIELRYRGEQPTTTQQVAFETAAARWGQFIVGDLTDVPIDFGADPAGCYPALRETVDDLVIYVDIVVIDGVGGILGGAGPCLARDDGFFPAVSILQLDRDDLAAPGAKLPAVLEHEMAHAMGFGAVLWRLKNLIADEFTDPVFVGPSARAAYGALAPSATGPFPPLEDQGGPGTRLSHWRESVFGNELMTGFAGLVNPLSALTVASFRDFGYLANDANADSFALVLAALAGSAVRVGHSRPWAGPLVTVDRRGRAVRVLR